MAHFKVTKLYCWPNIAQLRIHHAAHTNASGDAAHRSGITQDGVRFQYAPAVSPHLKEWVCTKILAGTHTRQILEDHYKNSFPKIQAGTVDRDCFLTSQDIRNINSKLALLSWKKHQTEAQSVRLFCEQHASIIFIYQEQVNGQSNAPAVDIQPADQSSQLKAPLQQPVYNAACSLYTMLHAQSYRLNCKLAKGCCLNYTAHLQLHLVLGYMMYCMSNLCWCAFAADEWVKGSRDVPHSQQDTTAACEGFHSAIKGDELATKTRLQGMSCHVMSCHVMSSGN